MRGWKIWLLGLVIVLVDLATAANLFEFYSWFEHPFFALLVALAFAALQIGTLVLFAMPLPVTTRRLLFIAAAILLSVNGLANVAMGYVRSRPVLPAAELLPALGFGGDAVSLGVVMAYATGLALVVAASVFWIALGQHVRQERDREQEAIKALDEMFSSSKQER
jgi:hypothetical protein